MRRLIMFMIIALIICSSFAASINFLGLKLFERGEGTTDGRGSLLPPRSQAMQAGQVAEGGIATNQVESLGLGITSVPCTDSDNGRLFHIAGEVSGQINSETEPKLYPDKCASADVLVESYCNGWTGFVQFNKVVCPNGCEETANGAVCSQPPYCLDVDRSDNPKLKGYVFVVKSQVGLSTESLVKEMVNQNLEIYQDVCLTDVSTKRLRQHSCDSTGYTYTDIDCGESEVCSEGRCIREIAEQKGETQESGILGTAKGTGESGKGGILIFEGTQVAVGGVYVGYNAENDEMSQTEDVPAGQSGSIGGYEFSFAANISVAPTAPAGSTSTSTASKSTASMQLGMIKTSTDTTSTDTTSTDTTPSSAPSSEAGSVSIGDLGGFDLGSLL